MSTISTTPPAKSTASVKTGTNIKEKTANAPASESDVPFLFDRSNYMWMIGGVVLILIGFLLMAGGKSPDPHQFNYDVIYSFRRVTAAPVLIVLGFIVEVYAIMKRPAQDKA